MEPSDILKDCPSSLHRIRKPIRLIQGQRTPCLKREAKVTSQSSAFLSPLNVSAHNLPKSENVAKNSHHRKINFLMKKLNAPCQNTFRKPYRKLEIPPLNFDEEEKALQREESNPFRFSNQDELSNFNPFASPGDTSFVNEPRSKTASVSFAHSRPLLMSPSFQRIRFDKPAFEPLIFTPVSQAKSAATKFDQSMIDKDFDTISRISRKPKLDGLPKLDFAPTKKLIIVPL